MFAFLESVICDPKGIFWNGICHTRPTSMVGISREHWMWLWRLDFAERRIGSAKPRLWRGISCTSVCILSPLPFSWSGWKFVYTNKDREEIFSYKSSPIKLSCDPATDFQVEPFSFSTISVDPNIAGMSMGENYTQLYCWHWSGNDGSILPLVIVMFDTTIRSIVISSITSLPNLSWQIRVHWGCHLVSNGDGGPQSDYVTPILHNNTAAGWVKVAWNKPIQSFCGSFIIAKQPSTQQVPWRIYMVAVATELPKASFNLQPRMWLEILRSNHMLMQRRSVHLQETSWQRKQASNRITEHFSRGLIGSSDTLILSETVLLVALPCKFKLWLLTAMWLSNSSTIRLRYSCCEVFGQ